jgi:hypothetical protein
LGIEVLRLSFKKIDLARIISFRKMTEIINLSKEIESKLGQFDVKYL